ncbi:MAG: glycosyltransferase family 39 protein [Deltaproteobacteria bacterium]|nr:glycosyltransferase family 39 protein [Deltaproteobacteria bacterium]
MSQLLSDDPSSTPKISAQGVNWIDRLLCGFIAIGLLLKLHLVFLLSINWDEYHYLSYVYQYLQGELSSPWQTFHVRLFSWLPAVPGYEIGQVFTARFILWFLGGVSTALTYAIGRRFLSRSGALFGALSYLSFSYLVEHSTSFRPDTLSVPLFLGAIYLVLSRSTLAAGMGAGVLLALSIMITIKSVLFLGLVGLIFLLRWPREKEKRPLLGQSLAWSAAFLVSLAALWAWHQSGLVPAEVSSSGGYLKRSASKVFLSHGFFPRLPYFLNSLWWDFVPWLLLFCGGLLTLRKAVAESGERRYRAWTLLALSLPLTTLLLYRNAFPYYYVFILSPAVLFCGVSLESLLKASKAKGSWLLKVAAIVLVFAVGIQVGAQYLRHSWDQNGQQKVLNSTIHRMFPEPVPYIDRCSMVASFPKKGFFMSSWGMESYLESGKPILQEVVEEERPLFLIANVPSLWFFLSDEQADQMRYSLLPEDRQVLRNNFIQHWGWLFVAGKQLQLDGIAWQQFEILIPGPYTLESPVAVEIDGHNVDPGGVLHLDVGLHQVKPPTEASAITLRWGDHIYRPEHRPIPQRLFRDF